MVQLIFMKGRLLVNSDDVGILNRIGKLHWENNNQQDALVVFERAIEIDPHHTLSNLNIAGVMLGLSDHLGAAQKCNGILERQPDCVQALLLMGKIHIKSQNFSEAEKNFEKASKICPLVLKLGKGWRLFVRHW